MKRTIPTRRRPLRHRTKPTVSPFKTTKRTTRSTTLRKPTQKPIRTTQRPIRKLTSKTSVQKILQTTQKPPVPIRIIQGTKKPHPLNRIRKAPLKVSSKKYI